MASDPLPCVMVVEDDHLQAECMALLLSDSARVVKVGSLQEALQLLPKQEPSLILLDLYLPDSLGLDTLRRIKERAADAAIVVLTGMTDDAVGLEALALGASDYLIKGELTAPVLVRVLRYALERKKIERALRQREEQLVQAQKMEAAGRLAGGVAHDFNNMLTAIGGFAELAADRLEPDHPAREELEQIQQLTQRGSRLVAQLLAIGRRQVLQATVFNLAEEVQRLTPIVLRLLGNEVMLKLELDPGAPLILFDPSQLEQILLNLTLNAKDAMPGGGTLTLQVKREGDGTCLNVRDTGTGIPAELQKQIFEPFFSTRASGSGLGLAIVYGIVTQAGGTIEVESEVGVGTTFRIQFPPVKEHRAPAPTSGQTAKKAAQKSEPGKTILVVEDEPAVRAVTCAILTRYGYNVLKAQDGVEALEVLNSHPDIDLVFTDVVMPRMKGPELARQLDRTHPALKVLFTSGYSDDQVLRGEIEAGKKAFLPKPFTAELLLDKIKELMT